MAGTSGSLKILGADFGSLVKPADPCCIVAIARDHKTGALHMISLEIDGPQAGRKVSAPLSSQLALGQAVSLHPGSDYAMVSSQAQAGTYSFPILSRAARPGGGIGGPADLGSRVAQLQQENDELKGALAELRKKGTPPEPGALRPVTTGHYDVYYRANPQPGTRIVVKLNGELIGTYDAYAAVYLKDLVEPGFENELAVEFEGAASPASFIDIQVQRRPGADWIMLHKVTPASAGKNTFKLPIAPR